MKKYIFLEYSVYVLAIVALYVIITIQFDFMYKFEVNSHAKEINEVLLNLSYSVFAACIFDLITIRIPNIVKNKKLRIIIKRNFWELQEAVRQAKFSVHPLMGEAPKSKEEYVNLFKSTDLSSTYQLNITKYRSIREFLEFSQLDIKRRVMSILDYRDYLSMREIEILTNIVSSTFIQNRITPRIFELDESIAQTENQEEMGSSLFDLNVMARNLYNTIV